MKNIFNFNRLVAVLTIPIAMFLIVLAYRAPRPNVPQIVGPHVWPISILGLMIICAIFLFLQTIRKKEGPSPCAAAPVSDTDPDVDLKWYRKPEMTAVLTIAGLLVYAFLLGTFGFLICTILLVVYQTRVIQKGHWARNIITAVIFSLAVYFGMTKLLMVNLPPGLLGW